jgi:Protein of unknown function (DUF3050)
MPEPADLPSLKRALAPLRAELLAHPLYTRLASPADVCLFMEHHVFAVWDFMSLLKALQRELTSLELAWRPRGDAVARRLINEIVVGEESDDDRGGGYISHFELYHRAMREAGASTEAIDEVIARLERGQPVMTALQGAPGAARRFAESTFQIIAHASLPRTAAAFTLGREDVIPDMFQRLVRDLNRRSGGRFATFVDYLERHIHLDGERHGPMSMHLLQSVCGDDPRAWSEARQGAELALRARVELWQGIVEALGTSAQQQVAAR